MEMDATGPQSGWSTPGVSRPAPARSGELTVLGAGAAPPPERADAARNRLRVLAAAEHLFAERGVAGVTMDDIAAEAQVGKGTLYRRFADKGGLAFALLDQRERDLQQQILSGPPPLGPGTDPTARLTAFIDGYLRFLDRHLDLVLLSETSTPGARLRTGAHSFWGLHCRYLLDQAGAPSPDLRAELLLAGLAADQVRHWLRHQRRTLDDLRDGLSAAALALAQPGRSG
jgi:AcrR family transcriptional regulator